MAYTDIVNPTGNRAFIYPPPVVRLSGDGTPPDHSDDERDDLFAIKVVQSAGGQELDYADLSWAIASSLINRVQPANFSRMLDVLLPDSNTLRVHLGDYVSETEAVDNSESLTAQSQLRGYHFGDPLEGERWWEPVGAEDVTLNADITFNPVVDGRVLGNKSDKKRDDSEDAYLWIHPEAALTSNSETVSDQTADEWDLKEAILAICWQCNTDETHILNPARADLDVLDDAPTVEGVALPRGKYLPHYLDALLHPLGYNWYVDYIRDGETGYDGDDKPKPKIVVFQKGVGTEKELQFQAPGQSLDLENSNCNRYRIDRRIGDQHNAVRVVGDVERREVTLPLYPAWPASDDSLTAAALTKSTGASYVGKETVHRMWVANEAGDYTGLRTTGFGVAGDPPDLRTEFTKWIPHRRTIEPPITYLGAAANKEKRDVLIEFSVNSGTSWKEYTGTVALVPDQIGVLFTDDEPPADLITAGSTARVRITGTVAGDSRVEGVADRESHAVNGREVWLEIDRPDKFQDVDVQQTGTYASALAGLYDSGAGAAVRDDTTEITDYAERLRDNGGTAEVDCEFRLPGIHVEYNIGDLLTKIAGREVSLDQASDTATVPVYVQIVKRSFEFPSRGGPVTILTVDRGTRYVPETVTPKASPS